MTNGHGRPLRFVALVLCGWVAIRMWFVWPGSTVTHAFPPVASVSGRSVASATVPVPRPEPHIPSVTPPRSDRAIGYVPAFPPPPRPAGAGAPLVAPRSDRPLAPSVTQPGVSSLPLTSPVPAMAESPTPTSRWSASGWLIVRGDGGRSGVATPQLGGSQGGMRVAYAITPSVAVAARAATALGSVQQEAAIGMEWAVPRLPVRLVAERRIGVARSRSGFGLGIVGGVVAHPVTRGLRLDGYGQAGVIARDGGVEGYGDGALRLSRTVWRGRYGAAIDLGLGAWGAAQRGAARWDAGPALGMVVPVGGTRVRLSLEWRGRVAGRARPASGPALSIGADL